MSFKQAEREKLKALIAMMGASGHGKTFSSLLLAKGMIKEMFPDLDDKSPEFWSKIGVIDTEHNRSKIYTDVEKHGHYIGKFMHMNMTKPFSSEKYIKGIKDAHKAGIEVLVIDSTTHLWKELLAEQSDLGGRYQDWAKVTPKYEAFIEEFTQSDIHIIATMRSKQDYALEKDSFTEKLEVKKLGTKPVQRDDFEYEFLLAFMFNADHNVKATKDNTPLFEELGEFKITPEHGQKLIRWLDLGIDVKAEEATKKAEYLQMIEGLIAEHGKEVQKSVASIENHKNVKMKIHEMPLEWLEKTYNVALNKAKELKESEKVEA
jgi:hypothetical protein